MRNFTNIFEQVAEMLMKQIDDGELVAGDKLPSEISLAQSFQVSRCTIVKALTVLERLSYVSKAERGKRRTVINRGARKVNNSMSERRIVLALPEDKEYFDLMITEFENCCRSVGYQFKVIKNLNRTDNFEVFNEWIERHYDGALIMQYFSGDTFNNYPYLLLEKSNFPFVMLSKPPRKLLCNSVSFDDYFASYQIVDSLYMHRCAEIIYITDSRYNAVVRQDRQEGYVDRVLRQGQKEANVFDLAHVGDMKRLEEYLVSMKRKVGIAAYNNILFQKIKPLLGSLEKKSGVDYVAASFHEKNVGHEKEETLFYVPKDKIVRRAFQMLCRMIEKNDMGESVTHAVFSFDKK